MNTALKYEERILTSIGIKGQWRIQYTGLNTQKGKNKTRYVEENCSLIEKYLRTAHLPGDLILAFHCLCAFLKGQLEHHINRLAAVVRTRVPTAAPFWPRCPWLVVSLPAQVFRPSSVPHCHQPHRPLTSHCWDPCQPGQSYPHPPAPLSKCW